VIGHVDKSLRSSDIVNGRNASMHNPKVFHDRLDDGRNAIGRTRSVGDQESFLGKQIMIATQDDIQGSCFLDGCRDDDLLHAALIKVWLQGRHSQELAGTLQDHFHTHGLEINIGKVLLLTKRESLIVDLNAFAIIGSFDRFAPSSVHTVIL
jgi:hypothetical protein